MHLSLLRMMFEKSKRRANINAFKFNLSYCGIGKLTRCINTREEIQSMKRYSIMVATIN